MSRSPYIREMIGRTAFGKASLFKSRLAVTTVDSTRPDYEFWDKLRRGKAKGYTISGLFARRIAHILATWTFGRGVTVALKEPGNPDEANDPRTYTDAQLAEFIEENAEIVIDADEDAHALGDAYLIVNPDGTISVPSPDTVEIETDPEDYRTVVRYTVTAKLESGITVIDEYRLDGRTITTKKGGETLRVEEFANLIGRIPVIHIANDRTANEIYGHSSVDALRPLLDQYDDVIYKMLDGAKLLGNPILTLEGLKDVGSVINLNDTAEDEVYTDKDGNSASRKQLTIDQNAILLLGEGGSAKFTAPPTGFTGDTRTTLKSLFLMLLDHTGIPEFIWGNELSGAHATTDVQMEQWGLDVEGRQKRAGKTLRALCEIWLLMKRLTDPRLVFDALTVQWPSIIAEDEALHLQQIQFAKQNSLLTDKTALELLDLVPDPAKEAESAQKESRARQDEFTARLNEEMDREMPANGNGNRQRVPAGAAA
jgi:hypothetical protein